MNTSLWNSIQAFQLDSPDASFQFSERLQRENGWSGAYTARVVEEYRRFIYLCVEAGHPVTPSDEVDQAWHLHLCYTRSYWEDLCRDTLGKQIHHGPTKGGNAEGEKFKDWYSATLQSYQKHFGCEPPIDIWPGVETRFRPATWRRVDQKKNLVLRRSTVWFGIAGAFVALVTAGCSLKGEELTALVFCVVGLCIVVSIITKYSGKGGGTGGSSCGAAGGCAGNSGCGDSSGCGGGGCGGGCGS